MELSVSFRPNLLYVKTKDIPIRISQGTETGTDIVVELEKGRKNVLLPRIELLYQDVQLFLPIVPRTPPSRPNCDWVLGYSTWHTGRQAVPTASYCSLQVRALPVQYAITPVHQCPFINYAPANRIVPPLKLSNACFIIRSTNKVTEEFFGFTFSLSFLPKSFPSYWAHNLVRRYTFIRLYCS